MLNQAKIEIVLEEMARQKGHELNEQERLIIRTRLSCALSAKERHRKRMSAPEYKWKKITPPRR